MAGRWERIFVPVGCALVALAQWWTIWRIPGATGFGDWQMIQHNWEAAYIALSRFGEWPLWDPFHCGGISIFRNPESQLYSPFFPLSFVVGTVWAIKLMLWAHVAFGLWGAYRLARDAYALPVPASAVCACIWACSGCIVWDGTGGHATFLPFTFTPWLIWLMRTPRPTQQTAAGVALLCVVALYEGGTYPLPFFVLLLAFELVLRVLAERTLRPALGLGATIALLTALAGMLRILPSALALREFPRQVPNNDAVTLGEVLTMLTARMHAWRWPGHPFVWAEYGSYVGWLALLLAAAGAVRVAWRGPRHLLAGLVLFSAFMLGNHGPYAPWSLLHYLPVYDSLRVPTRFAMFVTLYLALLAGHGLGLLGTLAQRLHWPRVGLCAMSLVAALQLGDMLVVSQPIIDRWYGPPLEAAAPTTRFHLVSGSYGKRYASYPRLNLGTPSCYNGAMNWRVSKALWVGDEEQVRVQSGEGSVSNVRHGTGRWQVDVQLTTPGRLWFNQNVAAGWRSDTGELLADQDLLALDLPAGRHRVLLRYLPQEWLPCALLGVIGWVLIAILGVRGSARRR
ncbi:MAG TPA: hypothetical protein VJV78_46400 [Polyangiales bacterium]|nr:hypothetical protein [Polyangiales bacterium]